MDAVVDSEKSDELAAAVVFLGGPAANYVTCATLIVDGGLNLA